MDEVVAEDVGRPEIGVVLVGDVGVEVVDTAGGSGLDRVRLDDAGLVAGDVGEEGVAGIACGVQELLLEVAAGGLEG